MPYDGKPDPPLNASLPGRSNTGGSTVKIKSALRSSIHKSNPIVKDTHNSSFHQEDEGEVGLNFSAGSDEHLRTKESTYRRNSMASSSGSSTGIDMNNMPQLNIETTELRARKRKNKLHPRISGSYNKLSTSKNSFQSRGSNQSFSSEPWEQSINVNMDKQNQDWTADGTSVNKMKNADLNNINTNRTFKSKGTPQSISANPQLMKVISTFRNDDLSHKNIHDTLRRGSLTNDDMCHKSMYCSSRQSDYRRRDDEQTVHTYPQNVPMRNDDQTVNTFPKNSNFRHDQEHILDSFPQQAAVSNRRGSVHSNYVEQNPGRNPYGNVSTSYANPRPMPNDRRSSNGSGHYNNHSQQMTNDRRQSNDSRAYNQQPKEYYDSMSNPGSHREYDKSFNTKYRRNNREYEYDDTRMMGNQQTMTNLRRRGSKPNHAIHPRSCSPPSTSSNRSDMKDYESMDGSRHRMNDLGMHQSKQHSYLEDFPSSNDSRGSNESGRSRFDPRKRKPSVHRRSSNISNLSGDSNNNTNRTFKSKGTPQSICANPHLMHFISTSKNDDSSQRSDQSSTYTRRSSAIDNGSFCHKSIQTYPQRSAPREDDQTINTFPKRAIVSNRRGSVHSSYVEENPGMSQYRNETNVYNPQSIPNDHKSSNSSNSYYNSQSMPNDHKSAASNPYYNPQPMSNNRRSQHGSEPYNDYPQRVTDNRRQSDESKESYKQQSKEYYDSMSNKSGRHEYDMSALGDISKSDAYNYENLQMIGNQQTSTLRQRGARPIDDGDRSSLDVSKHTASQDGFQSSNESESEKSRQKRRFSFGGRRGSLGDSSHTFRQRLSIGFRRNEADKNPPQTNTEDCTNPAGFSELSPWLEHCRDPVALKNLSNVKGSKYGSDCINTIYDPMQDVHKYEAEEKMMNVSPDVATSSNASEVSHESSEESSKAGGGSLIGAVDDMEKVCKEFSRFFRDFGSFDAKAATLKKDPTDLNKLEDLLSSESKHDLPTCQSFPKDILVIVELLPGNDKCCDCGEKSGSFGGSESKSKLTFGSPTYGTLLCQVCAFRHITQPSTFKGKGIVLSLEDGEWSLPNILAMIEGGNQAMINFIQRNETQKKQRRSSFAESRSSKRRSSLLQSSTEAQTWTKRKSMDCKDCKDVDAFSSDFERVYSSKTAASYRKILSDRTRWVMLKKVLA